MLKQNVANAQSMRPHQIIPDQMTCPRHTNNVVLMEIGAAYKRELAELVFMDKPPVEGAEGFAENIVGEKKSRS